MPLRDYLDIIERFLYGKMKNARLAIERLRRNILRYILLETAMSPQYIPDENIFAITEKILIKEYSHATLF